jgi:fumarate reductase flavoprotein subunit
VTPFLAMPGELVVTVPLVDLGAILVNQAGQRFADESAEPLALANAVRAQPGRVAYLLFDERIGAAARVADPFFARVVLPRTERRGTSVGDLAKQFELDAAGLTRTIDAFNEGVARGHDAFGRRPAAAALEAPFHAIRVTGARRRTLGGLVVDGAARALGAEAQPIVNLYATGGAVAACSDGGRAALAGIEALTALGLGRLAALDVIARSATEES